jgi:hypothetical protein
MPKYTGSALPATPVRARLSTMSKRQRVAYARDIAAAKCPFPRLTKTLIARACGVSLSSLRRQESKPLSDTAILSFVRKAGVNRVFSVINFYTSPPLPLQAAE